MISDALGRSVKLRVSANALKTVDHRGGLDAFLLKAKDDELSTRALDLKRQIQEEASGAPGASRQRLGCVDSWLLDQGSASVNCSNSVRCSEREIVVGDQRQHDRRRRRCGAPLRPSMLSI